MGWIWGFKALMFPCTIVSKNLRGDNSFEKLLFSGIVVSRYRCSPDTVSEKVSDQSFCRCRLDVNWHTVVML